MTSRTIDFPRANGAGCDGRYDEPDRLVARQAARNRFDDDSDD